MIKKIIKISVILLLALLVLIAVRSFTAKQGLVATIDHYLEDYRQQQADDELEDEEQNSYNEEDDDDDAPSRVEIYKGLPAVKLDEEVIAQSGIELSTLQLIKHLNEAQATGQVIDFEPLLQKRTAYQKAEASKTVIAQRLNAANKIYNRLLTLYKERTNVSLRQVEEARLEKVENQAQLQAENKQMENIRLESVQHWGKELTNWALGKAGTKEKTSYFDRLLQNKDVLVMASLPPALDLPAESSFIFINSHPERISARKAYLISPATYTNNVSQGLTYYFRTPATALRIGMRLNAWIVLSDEIETGVNVPLTAVVWYGGQPWVYVQVDEDLYQRRPVSDYRETDFGWFIRDSFKQDDNVVTRGGQLLLSEELRWQIPEEDDD